MICIDTEKKLAEVFLQIASLERNVEKHRFDLSSHPDFDPLSTFRAVDTLGLGCFSINELLSLLEKFQIYCTNDEAYLTIKQYDTFQNGRLSVNEFFQLVLPSTCPPLKAIAQSRQGVYTQEVEDLFLALLQSEVVYHRSTETLKTNLMLRHDFSILECFRAIDIRDLSYINRKVLIDFLTRHKKVNEEDVNAIFRRLDNDGDDLLTYQEFVEAVMPSQVTPFRSLRGASPLKLFKPERSYPRFTVSSPLRKTVSKDMSSADLKKGYMTSPVRHQISTFASSIRSVNSESPRKTSPLRSLRTGFRSSNLNVSSRSINGYRKTSPLRKPVGRSPEKSIKSKPSIFQEPSKRGQMTEEKELVNWFQEEIKISRDLEKKKNMLALKHDFTLISAFKLFDVNGTGYLNIENFEETFNYLGFSAPRDELYLLLKHFSQYESGRLVFSDFSEMLSPKQEEYFRILRNRSPDEDLQLSQDSLNLLLDVFRAILDAESLAEQVRQRLAKLPGFSLYQAFSAVDKDKNGFITIDEFQSILHSHGIFASCKDLQNLLVKYDKDRDGRVCYSDFVQEITPRSRGF